MIAYFILVTSFMAMAPYQLLAQGPAACGVQPSAVLGRSSAGVAQVSNLQLIHMQATVVPRRPVSATGVLPGLRAEAVVYEVAGGSIPQVVPSRVTQSGGGGDSKSEYVGFVLDIPIDPSERDSAIRAYVSSIGLPAAGTQVFTELFRQHRLGRFQIECRVLDGERVVGAGRGDLEVVFKGRFFDQEAFRKK